MNQKLQRLSQALAPTSPVEPGSAEVTVPFQRFAAEEPEPLGEFSLRDYWHTIHARRWTIISMAAMAVALAAVYNYVQVPTYQARATILIDREAPDISQLDENYGQVLEQPDYIETQYKVLRSRSLAKHVITALGLQDHVEFQPETDQYPSQAVKASFADDRIEPAVVDKFLERLGVSPGKGTHLVDVSFESVDRELAPAVVNTLAEEYIEHNLEAKWNATQKASTWLQQQLSTLKAKLEASETQLQEYAAQHSILFVEERKDITTEKLAQLEDELTRAEADRIHKQSLAMLVEDAMRQDAPLPGSLNSKTYQEHQSKLAELRREYSQLLVTFAPGYPKVQRIEKQIEEVERAIGVETERMLSNVRETFEVAERREELLKQASWSQRARVNRLSDDFLQYNILKRDAETNREVYEGLLQRLKEAGVSAGLRASNISVLDPAEVPGGTYRPKKLRNLLLALACGLLFGIGPAFVKEHLNTIVRTPEEVERMTGLGLLAVIPKSRQQIQKVKSKRIGGGRRSRS